MKMIISLSLSLFIGYLLQGQSASLPCGHEATIQRQIATNPEAEKELQGIEARLAQIIEAWQHSTPEAPLGGYVIPVVMHVFHVGDDGKMGMEQARSGLDQLNRDFNGQNEGWETVDDQFKPVRGALDITFCLATIDPLGQPTTGVIYHEDEEALYNRGNVKRYAWDNLKYLNIYFPKYVFGGPSDFTAYASYPSLTNVMNNQDGIVYSSIRWGYGEHSELSPGDDWASVGAHEAGHWLNLRHTYASGCDGVGDLVADTPPTLGGTIQLQGCDNQDLSCGVPTNGENFMDYNHRCKKMFTLGQVERMTAALQLEARSNLWSEQNLIATGCQQIPTSTGTVALEQQVVVFPNPASQHLRFSSIPTPASVHLYSQTGQFVSTYLLQEPNSSIDIRSLSSGGYFFTLISGQNIHRGKFMIVR